VGPEVRNDRADEEQDQADGRGDSQRREAYEPGNQPDGTGELDRGQRR
jgi:hypothetical protein